MKPSVRVICAMLGLTGVVLAVSWLTPPPAPIVTRAAVVSTPIPTATPVLDPMQIEAMRARTYPTSPLTVVRDLGDQGGYTETISSFKSDGLTQYALVSTPTSARPDRGWPVVIIAHGYIHPSTYKTDGPNYAGPISTLARAGYMVVKPDYRGHGQSEGEPAGGHYSPVYAYDILNVISAIKDYGPVDTARIGLLGHSMGGHAALRAAVVSKDIKATVFMNGVVGSMHDIMYNWPRSPILRDQPRALVQGVRQGLLSRYGTPSVNPDFWASASAINYVHYISGPVQIHHAIGDSLVPKLFSDHLSQAMTEANKPAEYLLYPGDDHQIGGIKNRPLFLQRIVSFYGAHL